MRHRKAGRKFNMEGSQRSALFRNLTVALIESEAIKTTVPRAKELRRIAEPLFTKARVDTVANRRLLFSRLRSRKAISKLFSDIAPRLGNRPGGYLRIVKCGFRPGDAAPMALISFVD